MKKHKSFKERGRDHIPIALKFKNNFENFKIKFYKL
jgi:hypothetical protein